MRHSLTYRWIARFSALLLIAGVIMPACLSAAHLAEAAMASHEEMGGMHSDHSCCPAGTESPDAAGRSGAHDCESAVVCSCRMDQPLSSKESWIAPVKVAAGPLLPGYTTAPESHDRQTVQPAPAAGHFKAPPIFLLNSTFLN